VSRVRSEQGEEKARDEDRAGWRRSRVRLVKREQSKNTAG
jgi:hypothetical protein